MDTLHLITQAVKAHTEWYYALMVFIGFGFKLAFDVLDQNVPTDRKTPEGRKTIKSWILGFLCSFLFFGIIILANITSHATNDYSFALFLLCYTFTGYLAPHVFLKGAALFQTKVDQKAGITITETKTTDIQSTLPDKKP